jgi:kynurenine formamidase
VTDAVQTLAAALASGQVEVVDLTQPLSEQTPTLPLPEPFANTPKFRLRELSRFDERGPAWYWNALEGGEHTGTHFDAPIHWATGRDQDDVSLVPPSRLIGPAVVIDHADRAAATEAIRGDELACLVAKVEPVGPKSFHMDLHLLENRFEFQRALRPDPQGAPS